MNLLVHAEESLKLVNAQVKALAAGLKEFHDLVHPNRAAASTWRQFALARSHSRTSWSRWNSPSTTAA